MRGPSTEKTFRVFVSSTFNDLTEERRLLHEHVFPAIERKCSEAGARFQAIDLRWGVSEESQLDHQTMSICLGEIQRCQLVSPRPNFILLLGDRYGWEPLPARIPGRCMATILQTLPKPDRSLLNRWYLEDLNAVPTEYTLSPRKGDFIDPLTWAPMEDSLRTILRKGAASLPEKDRIPFFSSATHQEIIAGLFEPSTNRSGVMDHILATIRTNTSVPAPIGTCPLDPLADLKGQVRNTLDPSAVVEYEASGVGSPSGHPAMSSPACQLTNPEAFVQAIQSWLLDSVGKELEALKPRPHLDEELEHHQRVGAALTTGFLGRKVVLETISGHLQSDRRKPLTLIGSSGSGKSSVMAMAMQKAESKFGVIGRFCGTSPESTRVEDLVPSLLDEIGRLLGTDRASLIAAATGSVDREQPTGQAWARIFHHALGQLSDLERPCVLFLDAVDSLVSPDGQPLAWVPIPLPEHVSLILSTTNDHALLLPELTERLVLPPMAPEEGAELIKAWLGSAGRTLRPQQLEKILDGFSANRMPLYLRIAFEEARKWHSFDQVTSLPDTLPGILELFFEALERAHGLPLVSNVCTSIVCGREGGLAEADILGLLAWDDGYWDALVSQSHPACREQLQAPRSERRLPAALWARLYHDLAPYLVERSGEGGNLLAFFHRIFTDHVRARYVSVPELHHAELAHYFQAMGGLGNPEGALGKRRRLSELPWQLTRSGQWEDLQSLTLENFSFVTGKVQAGLLNSLVEDYRHAIELAPGEIRSSLTIWQTFFLEREHLYRRARPHWPSELILLQTAIEHADDSPLTRQALEWIQAGHGTGLRLINARRPQSSSETSCQRVLEGHSRAVFHAWALEDGQFGSLSEDGTARFWSPEGHLNQTYELWAPSQALADWVEGLPDPDDGSTRLEDGRFLSWFGSGRLRLWSRQGILLAELIGHEGAVLEAQGLSEGRILSWSRDGTLRIWDQKGLPLATLRGQEGAVFGATPISGGRVVSWTAGPDLQMWSALGGLLATLHGHTDQIIGVRELQDGRLLSWSEDGSLRFWSKKGTPQKILSGHRASVVGCHQTADGRILSWSADGDLWIWSSRGALVVILSGHADPIVGALDLPDGRILSWSEDGTLRIWSGDGADPLILDGHTSSVRGAMPLGSDRILSWSTDGSLRLWSQSGANIAVFRGHTCLVVGAMILHDERILSWSWDGTLRIWDSRERYEEAPEGHSDKVVGTARLSDNRIVSWSMDETLRFWSPDGIPLGILQGHEDAVVGAIVLRGDRILSWSYSDLRLWSPEGSLLAVLDGQGDGVEGATQTTDGRILSWSGEGPLQLWSSAGSLLRRMEGHKDRVTGCTFLPDGEVLSWSWDGSLRRWSADGVPIAAWTAHSNWVLGALIRPDGLILSWGRDGFLRLWSATGEPLGTLEGHQWPVMGATLLPDGRILSWSSAESIRLWSPSGMLQSTLDCQGDWVEGALVLADNYVLSWSSDESLCLWAPDGKVISRWEPALAPSSLLLARYSAGGLGHLVEGDIPVVPGGRGVLSVLGNEWHSTVGVKAEQFLPDGTVVASLQSGELLCLKLWSGKRRVSATEAKARTD